MTVNRKPFSSQYGFSSPGFEVDAQGNIVATSIVAAGASGGASGGSSDFSVTDSVGYFEINNSGQQNSALAVTRNTRFTFKLDLSEYTFSIFTDAAGTTLYSTGLSHTSAAGAISEGAAAQGKTSGNLLFTVPSNAPNTLYYGDATAGIIGTINIADASGLFGELSVTGTSQSTSITSGALVVAGGAGIQKNLSVGGYITTDGLDINGVGVSKLSSTTNLELDATNKIVIKNDGIVVGEIKSTGLTIPINNSSITSSTINSTTIGAVTPSTAAFTTATIAQSPTTNTSATNKYYVDKTATALSIAFGL